MDESPRRAAGRSPRDAGYGTEPREAWGTLDDGERSAATPTERGDYAAFYRALVRSIRDGTAPPVDPADALPALAIIEAAQTGS